MDSIRDTSGSMGQLSNTGSTGGVMHHSHSTPAGVDGGVRTPPTTPKKGGKMLAIRVQMLDDTITIFQVQEPAIILSKNQGKFPKDEISVMCAVFVAREAKALGRVLFDQVCKQLHLLEADYFGLEYSDMAGTKYWLDLQKPISRQLGLSLVDPLLCFCVKFYTPDPAQLEEEYTRYLFCLQVKRDLSHGLIQCNDNTAALMASYIVQAECGDYVSEDYPDHTYLSSYKFVPHQDQEMERRIMENHKKHAGQSPAEADLNLLETARRCELYGMKMHPAKDHENVALNLAVAHMGIVVFQHTTKINTFSWAKIRKISFKRKRFLIKLHPEGYGYYRDTVEFFFEGRDECKNFWKKCVENHGFFRCSSVKNIPRHKTRVLSRGSSFRYSGKTQKQIVEFVRDNYVKRQTFQRSASFRHSSAHSSASNMHSTSVGNSISAHPLLPLADSNLSVEASKLSASLGSMGGTVQVPGSPTTKLVSRPRGTVTCWNSVQQDTRATTLPVQTMNSPSPPLTTQSGTPVTSATTSPQHIPQYEISIQQQHHQHQQQQQHHHINSSPVAVRAAVHRADTGINNNNTHIHTTIIRMPSSHKSEGSLDHVTSNSSHVTNTTNKCPSQTQSQNNLDDKTIKNVVAHVNSSEYTYKSINNIPKRHVWQRSVSCRELYDFSFEDSGMAKRRTKPNDVIKLEERKLESPITRYDDHREIYASSVRNNSLEIHQDILMPDQKVYSSSYPGTTSYSQESMEDPGNYDLRDSQDDLSHDSYELLERSDDDYSTSVDYKKTKIMNTRSCSLDSGNYLPSDTDSDGDKRHKCKSSSDVHQDIFTMDDPRDFPREIIPRKSDGTFYKTLKAGSRTSSLESRSDYYDSKTSKSSKESLRKGHGHSFSSSQESKSDYETSKRRKNKSTESLTKIKNDYLDSRTSSLDSKSEYYDAKSYDVKNYDAKISLDSKNYDVKSFDPKSYDAKSFDPKSYDGKTYDTKSYDVKSFDAKNYDAKSYEAKSYDGKSYDSKSLVEESKNVKHEYDRKIQFQRNYGTHIQKSENLTTVSELMKNVNYTSFPSFKETSHVHSISLQNVETEPNRSSNRFIEKLEQNTVPRTQKGHGKSKTQESSGSRQVTHIWPESIAGIDTELRGDWATKQSSTRSTESESNIFSFDEDRIQSLQEGEVDNVGFSVVPNIDKDKKVEKSSKKKPTTYKEFMEIEPRKIDGRDLFHQPIERTKSDPNSLARQRLNSNSRRMLLMHQKSIDLTPAESSDEDYLYKQIPSAPPIMKYRGSHFEMPPAEFGHFDILKRESEGQKIKFEVPKSQFELLGAKTQSDLINLPPKNDMDIPYVLHKRHVMNGTSSSSSTTTTTTTKDDVKLKEKLTPDETDFVKTIDELKTKQQKCKSPKSPVIETAPETTSFLFTQNIDLSKVDPVTLEIDKTIMPIQHLSSPKRDITRIDPVLLEALSNKLSQIESDSPTSSKTESLKTQKPKLPLIDNKIDAKVKNRTDKNKKDLPKVRDPAKTVETTKYLDSTKPDIAKLRPTDIDANKNAKIAKIMGTIKPAQITSVKPSQILPKPIAIKLDKNKTIIEKAKGKEGKIKTDIKPKRIIKPRMQPNKKGAKNKTKVRITSFSSDDESLDSDDVFGSAEATPTKLEFSPPQTRKEMESILKYESERKYLQYAMSSTEVEGSPPQTRKLDIHYDRTLDPNYQTELRRISERSISIPSSEDDLNIKTCDLQPVFADDEIELPPLPIVQEVDKECETVTVQELLKEEDLRDIEEEKLKEKQRLQADIECDIKNLNVPTKTKITEICSPSLRRKGQSPLLFAHARLNLSEGSAFTLLQKQQATESPIPGRRAKSLDAPVIPVNRLPPLNAFSSKDDTVEEEDHIFRNTISESEKEEVEDVKAKDLLREVPDNKQEDVSQSREATITGSISTITSLPIIGAPLTFTSTSSTLPSVCLTSLTSTSTSLTLTNVSTTLTKASTTIVPSVSSTIVSTTPTILSTTNNVQKPKYTAIEKEKPKTKQIEKDQIVPDVTTKPKKILKATVLTKPLTAKYAAGKGKPPPTTPRTTSLKDQKPPTTTTTATIKDKQKLTQKPPTPKSTPPPPPPRTTTAIIPTTASKPLPIPQTSLTLSLTKLNVEESVDDEEEIEPPKRTLDKPQSSLSLPEIKRTKSQELETCKRPTPKEKAKSLEKLEFKRTISKERTKSQDDSDTDIVKRKEKQQMLYETAIKQTKTLKSPVKEILPVFPQVEEMVRERHGKLEISINTIDNPNVSLEEAIIITKSPKKLDKKMDKKYTKSLELNLNDTDDSFKLQRLGKSLDIDTTRRDSGLEFDFKTETIEATRKADEILAIADDRKSDQDLLEKDLEDLPRDDEIKQQDEELLSQDNVILEGTSLDVWISVDSKDEPKLENITVIQKSNDFFDGRPSNKPPDLAKLDTKSSSDSQSMEKISLGNSLDIKYIDDSGDSSHKSDDKDSQLIREMQKASERIDVLIKKKAAKKLAKELRSLSDEKDDQTLVRIISEDESLTEVSDLKNEYRDQDANFLGIADTNRDVLLKLSIERSRSEDTGSWITVDCEEYIGEESFDYDNAPLESPEKATDNVKKDSSEDVVKKVEDSNVNEMDDIRIMTDTVDGLKPDSLGAELQRKKKRVDETDKGEVEEEEKNVSSNLLSTEFRNSKIDLLKRSSDQSRSSDTTGSWTSGEKDLSPSNVKEGEESSLSCSMGRAIGISQTIEKFSSRDQIDKTSPEIEGPRSPRSPRICVLGRTFTIDEESSASNKLDKDEESSSDDTNEIPKDLTPIQEADNNEEYDNNGVKYKKSKYPFEQKWSNESELSQRLHEKISKKLSSADRSMSSTDDSRRNGHEKPSLHSIEKLSTESRNSVDTESSSGSLGKFTRLQKNGEVVLKEPTSTWKPFPLESSGSSSLEEGFLPTDQDLYGQEYFLSRENSGDFTTLDITYRIDDDITPTAENNEILVPYTGNFSSTPDLINTTGYGTSFLSRTLSRISERSTNSEKSSVEDDSMKGASTQSESPNEESNGLSDKGSYSDKGSLSDRPGESSSERQGSLSDRQGSTSSDLPSNARVSDSSKKLKKLMKKSEAKETELPICEPLPNISSLLQRQISDDRRTSAEMAELSIDDIEIITSERGLKLRRQNSDDTIIDEECLDSEHREKKDSSQESDEWPLPDIPQQKPLLALHETPSTDTSQITTQVFQPPRSNIPKTFGLRGSLKSQDSEQWPSPPSSVTEPPIVGDVETYYVTSPEEAHKVIVESSTISTTYDNDSQSDEYKTLDDKTHTYENVATDHGSESISESLSAGPSGVKIVLEKKSDDSAGSNSDDLNLSNLNDDVFTDTVEQQTNKNELRPPTAMRRSTTSDDSSHSHSGKKQKPGSQKSSQGSYSDEECSSSMGTTLEDGTVRYALKPTKCTHSSHSEDTSIALSLSEWSNSTNTVKFQNLSTSNSGTTKSSSGLKSDDNSLTDIAHSISEWSSSNSNTLKAQSLQFQKLSSTTSTTGDSTLTELVQTEWSSSESKTLIPQQFYPTINKDTRPSLTRLGSSIDVEDNEKSLELGLVKSPKNIPSEDASILLQKTDKHFTKSTERPVIIPPLVQITSESEKSTESSSMEQKTVHTQNYDKRYNQKHQNQSQTIQMKSSTERPVKVPLKLSKCSPYYSSSLSSESTPLASTSIASLPLSKTATIPQTRTHRKPVAKHLFQAKSPPSENDSTSSMESPKSKSDLRDRRGYRRRRPGANIQKKHNRERELFHTQDDYFYVEHDPDLVSYNEYIRNKSLDEMASAFHYENILVDTTRADCYNTTETLEEGYYPDVDSQSGSDIFRMERDDDDTADGGGFDVSCIPPPLLEDIDTNQI